MTILEKFMNVFYRQGQSVKQAFSRIDLDANDELSVEEFSKCCDDLNVKLTGKEIEIFFTQLDTDGDKKVTIQEFEEKVRAFELLKSMKSNKMPEGTDVDKKLVDDDTKPKPDPGIRNNPGDKKKDTDKLKKIVTGIGAITGLKNLGDDNQTLFENIGDGTLNDEIANLLISQTPVDKPTTNMDFTPLVGEVKL